MDNVDLKLSLVICSLQRALARDIDKGAGRAAPGWTEYCILRSAAQKPGIGVQQAASAASLTSGSATYVMDKLESEGLIERRKSKSDSRSRGVFLTERGAEAAAALSHRLAAVSCELFQGIIIEKKQCALDVLVEALMRLESK